MLISSLPRLHLRLHREQLVEWPESGRHIMAQFDSSSICVYQAFRPSIAEFAVEHQAFGGEFSFSRMSWIKPNFLWMMFRSGWATKPGQERILAVRLKRSFFDELLTKAVASTFDKNRFASIEDWKAALADSKVRLQWDPDHGPHGEPLERRAIQLGLRGETLRRYGGEAALSIEDITPFVTAQYHQLLRDADLLQTPIEKAYPI